LSMYKHHFSDCGTTEFEKQVCTSYISDVKYW